MYNVRRSCFLCVDLYTLQRHTMLQDPQLLTKLTCICTWTSYILSWMQADLCFPLQISPASTSTHLSNDRTFPNFIRTVSSSSEVVDGIIQAMKQYGWSRIALMTQSENIFTFVSYFISDHWSIFSKSIPMDLWLKSYFNRFYWGILHSMEYLQHMYTPSHRV